MPLGAQTAFGINVFEQVVQSRGMVLMVLLVLIGMSVITWFIIGAKFVFFRRIRRQTAVFVEAFWRSDSLDKVASAADRVPDAPVSRVFRAAHTEMLRLKEGEANSATNHQHHFENIERALRRSVQEENARLEKMTSFLATTGSSAPFIGLFGTVWGIMNAFAFIDPNRPILETVTPHIAQALVATAVGLLAAIPAVMAFNFFSSQIKGFNVEMDNFSIDFLNILKRHFYRE